jgi:hypothetical protein
MKIIDFILFSILALFMIIYIFLCSYGNLCQINQFKQYNITKPLDISYNDKLYNYFISIFGLIIGILIIVIELKYILPNFGKNIYIRIIQIILGILIFGLYYLPIFIKNYSIEQISYSLRPFISSISIILASSITIPTSI